MGGRVIARLGLAGLLSERRARRRALLAGVVVVVAAGLVRLAVAPVTLPLAALVERQVPQGGGLSVAIGRVDVQLGAGTLTLGLRDVRVRAYAASASVPDLVLTQGLSGRSVRLDGPLLRIDPSAGAGAGPIPRPDEAVAALDAALARVEDLARARGIDRVSVAGGRVELVAPGRPVAEARVFQKVKASVAFAPGLDARVELVGAEGRALLAVERTAGSAGREVSARVRGLVPEDIAHLKPVREGFPLALTFAARLSADGAVEGADLAVDVGPGTVVFARDPPRTLDSASLAFTLAPDGRGIVLTESIFVAGGSQVPATGDIVPGDEPGAPWRFAFEADGALFDPPDVDGGRVVDTLRVEGRLDLQRRLLHVDRFLGAMDEGRADAVLTVDFSPAGPRLSGAARLGSSTIPALRAVWPPVFAHGPREAALGTVLGGIVKRGELQFALTPLELDGRPETSDMIEGGMTLDVAFHDATLTAPGAPVVVQRARGLMQIRDKTLSARLDGGVVRAGEAGDLAVLEGTFRIPVLGAQPATGTLRATVEGPLSAVVAIAGRLDLPQLAAAGITPSDVTGRVRAELWLETPLAPDVAMSERRWSVDARLTGAGSAVPVAGRTVDDADLEVLVNARRLAARGRAVIDGLPVDVNYSELFAGGKSGAARFVLTDEERRRRGIDTGEALSGPVEITVEAGEDAARAFVADFTDARIDLPGFAKAAGETMTAEGTVVGEGATLQVQDLRLEGAGAAVAGALGIEDGALAWAAVDTLALSAGDEARLNVETREGGGFAVDLEAARLDARRLVADLKDRGGAGEGGDGPGLPPVFARVRADRVRLGEDAVASPLSIDVSHDGSRLERLALSGRIDGLGEGTFAARVAPGVNGVRDVQADVRELGRLLGALGIYGRMEGGRTTVEARIDPDGVVVGRVFVKDFVLTNERTLEAVIARARQEGSRAADGRGALPLAFRSEAALSGIPFERLDVDFEKRGDVILVKEAILRGPVLGGTVEGTVDLARDEIALNGTFIPAYGVNNLFGRLPIFGEILGGGQEGGLIGVTFRLAGPADDPQLLLNPISAIAPGIFRRIFEFR